MIIRFAASTPKPTVLKSTPSRCCKFSYISEMTIETKLLTKLESSHGF